MKTKPFLFLDIDGVLNSDRYTHKYLAGTESSAVEDPDLDRSVTLPLAEMLRKTRCQVVIISSWRHDRPALETIRRLLNAGFYGIPLEFLPGTEGKKDGTHTTRSELIADYLRKNPHITRFAIADDETMNDPNLLAHQVRPNPAEGLTEKQIKQLKRILKHQSKP